MIKRAAQPISGLNRLLEVHFSHVGVRRKTVQSYVFCKILRGPGFFHFFLCPRDSYFREQMKSSINKGVEYQASFKKIFQKLPYAPHWPELKHSMAAKCNLYSGTMLLAKVLGSIAVEVGEHVYQGTVSCLCNGGLAVGLACKGDVRAGCWAHLPKRLHLFFQEWTIRPSWLSSHCWMAKEQSLIQQARVSMHPLLSSH